MATKPSMPDDKISKISKMFKMSEIGEAATRSAIVTQKFREKIISIIVSFFKWIFDKVFTILNNFVFKGPMGKWVAVIIIAIIIFGSIGGAIASSNSDTSRSSIYIKPDKTWISYITDPLITVIKTIRKISSPLGQKATKGMPREEEKNGRCDNIEWVSGSNTIDGNNIALCMKTNANRPANVIWTIDPETLRDNQKIPSEIKEKIRNSNRLQVTIPYVENGETSYKLHCMGATYEDGTSAKDLFSEETDGYCKLNTKTVNEYKSRQRQLRSSNMWRGLDSYQ